MLYVTGADWFCMCDRAGPEAPAMGDSTGAQMFKWVWWVSQTRVCLQTSPGFPGFGFCSTFFRSAPTLPCCCQSMRFSLTTWNDCGSHMGVTHSMCPSLAHPTYGPLWGIAPFLHSASSQMTVRSPWLHLLGERPQSPSSWSLRSE